MWEKAEKKIKGTKEIRGRTTGVMCHYIQHNDSVFRSVTQASSL
jgi:hypothetical protein